MATPKMTPVLPSTKSPQKPEAPAKDPFGHDKKRGPQPDLPSISGPSGVYDLDGLAEREQGPRSHDDGLSEFVAVSLQLAMSLIQLRSRQSGVHSSFAPPPVSGESKNETDWSRVATGVGAACVAGVLLAIYFADDLHPAGANDDVYIAPTWNRMVTGLQLAWQSL